jgi:hypothetical protein
MTKDPIRSRPSTRPLQVTQQERRIGPPQVIAIHGIHIADLLVEKLHVFIEIKVVPVDVRIVVRDSHQVKRCTGSRIRAPLCADRIADHREDQQAVDEVLRYSEVSGDDAGRLERHPRAISRNAALSRNDTS